MNKRTEIPEYIGFQMSKNKWIEVVNPRYDTYKWLNRGASGHAYVNRNKVESKSPYLIDILDDSESEGCASCFI